MLLDTPYRTTYERELMSSRATLRQRDSSGIRPVAGVVATMISASLPPFIIGTIAIQIGQNIHFTPVDLAKAVAAYYVVSAALSPTSGHLVARLGPEASLRLAALGSSLGLIAVARADSPEVIVGALAFLGLPNSLVQPASNQVLSNVGEARRGFVFGLVQSAIPLSTLTSGLLLAIFGRSGDWRAAIWTVVVLTLLAQVVIPRGPALRLVPGTPVNSLSPDGSPSPAHGPRHGGIPLLAALVLGAFLASFAATTLPSFVAVTGQHVALSPASIASAQITGSLACIAIRIAAAWLGGRHGGPTMLNLVTWLLIAGSIGYFLLAHGASWSFLVGVTMAYAFGWGWNGLFNLSVIHARPHHIASTTGLTQGGVFFGGVCGPLAFAALSGDQHFSSAWAMVAVVTLAAAGSMGFARRRWIGSEVPQDD